MGTADSWGTSANSKEEVVSVKTEVKGASEPAGETAAASEGVRDVEEKLERSDISEEPGSKVAALERRSELGQSGEKSRSVASGTGSRGDCGRRESDNVSVSTEVGKAWGRTVDRSLDIGNGDARTSEDPGAEVLASSGGVETKLEANPKMLPAACWGTLEGPRAGSSGASTEGSKP